MLNLENIDMTRRFASEHEEIESLRSYIFQLYIELDFRLDELEKKIKEIKNEEW